MSGESFDVLIVGAGQAGATVATQLRQGSFPGSIGIVGEEPDLPYERPPLSKAYLAGEVDASRLALRSVDYWQDARVSFLCGERVVAVDAASHTAACASGRHLVYGRLVWAAGGKARRLGCPGSELSGVHVVRTRADVDRMRGELPAATHVVIVGAGYIGLETAAVLTKLGKSVDVLEAQARVLERVTSPVVSSFFEAQHRAHGVRIHTSAQVVALHGMSGHVREVELADGRRLAADLVVVGIGLVPEVQPLADAGARCANGVEVDEFCRTSLPDVLAVGDCASHMNRFAGGRRIRLESVQNANDQAKVAAASILGQPVPYQATPWFWSNQYDLKLQTVGLCTGHDHCVLRGNPETRSFSVLYLREGVLVAVDAINAPKDYMQARKLVGSTVHGDLARLADMAVDLAKLI